MAPIHRIGLFRRDDFQKFCSVLLSSDDADFRAIRGDGGDLGSDGFAAGATVVYQAYAPDIVTAAKFRHKIEESLTKASRLRAQVPSLSTFRLLTPFDLTIEQELHLEVEAKKRAFKSESWGESRLLAILARHPEVNRAFSEILLPDVVDEVRQLGAALLESLPRVGTEDFEDTLGENAMFPHFYVLQKDENPPHSERGSYEYWRAWIWSPALILPSMEPANEDEFLDAVRSRFWEDQTADFDVRDDKKIWVQHRDEGLTFHRRWGRWTTGTVAMAATLNELGKERRGCYSVADIAIDLARFLRFAAALCQDKGKAKVRFGYDPNQLRVLFDPADPRARERLGASSSASPMSGVMPLRRPLRGRTMPITALRT